MQFLLPESSREPSSGARKGAVPSEPAVRSPGEQRCVCTAEGCPYVLGAESCGFVASLPSHSPSQALMMDDGGPCRYGVLGEELAERRKALP